MYQTNALYDLYWFNTLQNYCEYSMSCNFWMLLSSLLADSTEFLAEVPNQGSPDGNSQAPASAIYIYIIYTYLYIYLYRREELPKRSLLSICCQFCKFAWHAAFKRFEVKCVEPASACFLLSLWDVYVCMSLSFCRHVSLCMMGVWTYVCLCGCMDVCTYVYIFVCLYVFLSVRLYLSVYLCIYICQCMHICILAYMILIKEY